MNVERKFATTVTTIMIAYTAILIALVYTTPASGGRRGNELIKDRHVAYFQGQGLRCIYIWGTKGIGYGGSGTLQCFESEKEGPFILEDIR